MKKFIVASLLSVLIVFVLVAGCTPPPVQGMPGEPGPQGEQGIPGDDGADGQPGADGQKGDDGADGQPGADGQKGDDGADGQDGDDGADGQPGADGADAVDPNDGIDPDPAAHVLETTTFAVDTWREGIHWKAGVYIVYVQLDRMRSGIIASSMYIQGKQYVAGDVIWLDPLGKIVDPPAVVVDYTISDPFTLDADTSLDGITYKGGTELILYAGPGTVYSGTLAEETIIDGTTYPVDTVVTLTPTGDVISTVAP